MSGQELMALGARLKQIISEYVPEQNITAKAGFYVDSDVVTLNFHISPQATKAEARRG